MAFTINTNIASLQSQDYLRVTSDVQSKTLNRVTSGLRIVSSGDDAAGLAIANGFRSDQAVLSQGVRNANDGLSTLQTIDGGMSNISKLLDRARTLATQSASGTFTGERGVLNDEFKSVISEIDRQAQAVGLNTGGTFAKNLSVFIGGGRSTTGGTDTITNGSVGIDLSKSTVDSSSLGLRGVSAVGKANSNLDVGTIVTNGTNTASADLGGTGKTTFYFSGAGFSGAGRMSVQIDYANATNNDKLVSALNSAIAAAGEGITTSATAFKNANITAYINTDSSGKQQLAFQSGSAAFQVQAGDRLSNALLGNETSNVGTAISSTLTAGAAYTAGNAASGNGTIYVRFSGAGLDSPVTKQLTVTNGELASAVLSDLQTAMTGDEDLKAAGLTVAGGANIVFTNRLGDQFKVEVTGDKDNLLGMGAFASSAAGNVDYNTVTSGSVYTVSPVVRRASSTNSVAMEVSINGAASNGNVLSVDLNGGDATAAIYTSSNAGAAAQDGQNGNTYNVIVNSTSHQLTIAGLAAGDTARDTALKIASAINTAGSAGWGTAADAITASVDASNHVVITTNQKGADKGVQVTAGTATLTGLGLSATTAIGSSRSGADIAATLNDQITGDAQMKAAGLDVSWDGNNFTIASSNDTAFRLNSHGTGDLGFGTWNSGVSFSGNGAVTGASSRVNSGGAMASKLMDFTAMSNGDENQAITVSAISSTGEMTSKTISLTNEFGGVTSGRSIDEAITAINTALQDSNDSTLKQIVAVKENSTGDKIRFLSTVPSFSVSVGTTAGGVGIGSTGATGDQGTTVAATALSGGSSADISNQTTAQSAVTALSEAVSLLGASQAVVGRGQNQFNYAVNLAQSQLSNLAAAESRIRDADLANEAANMTKAQIMLQAGIAALAQANSAPQQVLSLLRG